MHLQYLVPEDIISIIQIYSQGTKIERVKHIILGKSYHYRSVHNIAIIPYLLGSINFILALILLSQNLFDLDLEIE